jgi:hypothetical protein
MSAYLCTALILKEGDKKRTRCNTPYYPTYLEKDERVWHFCDKCRLEMQIDPNEIDLRTKKEKRKRKKRKKRIYKHCIKTGCLRDTSYEDGICRSCRSNIKKVEEYKKNNPEKNNPEKVVWKFILGVIGVILFLLLIGIIQQQGQQSRYSEIDNAGIYDDRY